MTLRSSWRRRSRRFRIATGTIAVLGSAVLVLWITRAQTTEWAIERFIDGFGLGPSDLKVTNVGLARAEMTLVSSAAGTIRRIHVDYALGDLLRGEIRHMVVDGARLRFAWKDGKLVPAITPSEGPISLPLERMDIRNSALTLDLEGEEIVTEISGTVTGQDNMAADLTVTMRAAQGRLDGRIVGRLQPDGAMDGTFTVREGSLAVGSVRAERLTGKLRLATSAAGIELVDGGFGFAQISSGGDPLGPGTLEASLRQPRNALHVALRSEPVSFSLQADGASPKAGVPFTLEGTADAGFVSALAGASEPATGGLHLRATGTAPPSPTMQEAFGAGLGDWLEKGKAAGGIDATVTRLKLPETVTVDKAVLSLDVKLENGALALTTPKGVTVTGMILDPSIAPKDSLFAGNSALSIAPAPGAPFLAVTPLEGQDRLTLSGGVSYENPAVFVRGTVAGDATLDPAQWLSAARNTAAKGDLNLKADVAVRLPEGRTLPAAELALAGTYDIGPAAIRLTADSGAMAVRDARWGEAISLPGSSRLALQPGAFYARNRTTGATEASGVLQPFNWTASLKREGAGPARATLAAARMALTMDQAGLKAVLERGRLELPDSEVAARGIAATIASNDAATTLSATIADLRGTGDTPLFTSLKANLGGRLAGSKATFTASLTGAGKVLSVTAKGNHDLDRGMGGATITAKPLDLSGDGVLQAFSPRLAKGIAKSAGTVSAGGAVHWGDGAAPGTLEVALKDVSLNGDDINISAVNGGVKLDSLSPLRTAAGQKISGVLHLPSINQMPFDVSFRLDPGTLLIEKASAQVFDGRFETENAAIDTATGNGRLELKISDINLETAFAVLDLEQLKGTGRIGGVLPLTIEGGKVKVEKGHMESSVAGTLQVSVDQLADQLQAYGENVDMAFRALTDFHYHRMVIDADKPFVGAGKALFRLEGNNPKVMDGQPFVFNISLETDFDYLTRLLLELSGAANTALGWGARELTKK